MIRLGDKAKYLVSMQLIKYLISPLLLFALSYNGFAQRAHEIQVQYGIYRNFGDGVYDYYVTESSVKHSFDFEQRYTANIFPDMVILMNF